ncbi:MAG: hypothetical protein RLZZ214_535 [Verrucomicrobiota bacterium]|jgi:hypothetical protein
MISKSKAVLIPLRTRYFLPNNFSGGINRLVPHRLIVKITFARKTRARHRP